MCKAIYDYSPGNSDLSIMVAIPAHPQTKRCLQGDVLTGQTERHEGRRRMREVHPQSIDLPEEKKKRKKILQDSGHRHSHYHQFYMFRMKLQELQLNICFRTELEIF